MTTTIQKPQENLLEKIVSLSQRRGFIFPNSEIYGGLAGVYDLGPLGAELKNNLVNSFWNYFITKRRDIVGHDGSILANAKVWNASGHVDAFNDPLVDCKKCKSRFRADALIEEELKISVDGVTHDKLTELIKKHKLTCQKCKGELTEARAFNMMFKTHIGPIADDNNTIYLRPETAQLIFTNYKQIQLSMRKTLPFGIAQWGKAFRNEIAPRNFIFRLRELTQAEIEFFVDPEKINEAPLADKQLKIKTTFVTQDDQEHKKEPKQHTIDEMIKNNAINTKWHAYWLAEIYLFYTQILGVKSENLRFRQHMKDELSHYSSQTWDLEYKFPWGFKEIAAVANRGDFDLTQHQKQSTKDLTYFEESTKRRFLPHVLEPTFGIDRMMLVVLCDAYEEKKNETGSTTTMHLKPTIAPYKIAILPLMKKDGLAEKAREITQVLTDELDWQIEYDEAGSIGKRYARNDEIGTPICITIDYDTLTDESVTIRDRDSTKQQRVKINELTQKCKSLILQKELV